MMTDLTTSIKRPGKTNIEDVLGDMKPQDAEETLKVRSAEGRPDYTTLLAKLEECLDFRRDPERAYEDVYEFASSITDVLPPDEITLLFQMTHTIEHHPEYCFITGIFISRLIQNSYNAGNNKFRINQDNLPAIDYFGYGLQGTKDRPLILIVTGETGQYFGIDSRSLLAKADKTHDCCGSGAEDSLFVLDETGIECGEQSNNCSFQIGTSMGNITYGIDQYVEKNLTFMTPNRRLARQMLIKVPKPSRIILIDDKGNEQIVRDYDD